MAGRSPPHENRGSALPAILSVHVSLIIIIAVQVFLRARGSCRCQHDVYFKFLFLRLGRLRAARRRGDGAFGRSPPSFGVYGFGGLYLLAVFWAEPEASLMGFLVSRLCSSGRHVHVSLIIIIADTLFRALVARVVVNHDVYFKFVSPPWQASGGAQ